MSTHAEGPSSRELLLQEIAEGKGQKLTDLCRMVPSYRQGKPATLGRVIRWILDGVRGPEGTRVHLDAVKGPSGWISTPMAIARFLDALTPPVAAKQPTAAPTGSRETRAARAAKQLEKAGI